MNQCTEGKGGNADAGARKLLPRRAASNGQNRNQGTRERGTGEEVREDGSCGSFEFGGESSDYARRRGEAAGRESEGGGKLEMRYPGRTNGRHVSGWHAWGSASPIHQCHHTGSGLNR